MARLRRVESLDVGAWSFFVPVHSAEIVKESNAESVCTSDFSLPTFLKCRHFASGRNGFVGHTFGEDQVALEQILRAVKLRIERGGETFLLFFFERLDPAGHALEHD